MTAPKFAPWMFVLPCQPNGKKALLPDWQHQATNDPAQIEAWSATYENCNWALACGPSGVGVVDVDGETGDDSLFAYELEHGDLPVTLEQKSPKGRHLIFRDPGATLTPSVGKLGKKLDTRGGASYILIAPSAINGVPYVFNDRAMAELPAHVRDNAGKAREGAAAPDDVSLDTPIAVTRATRLLRDYVTRGDVAVQGQGGDNRTYQIAAEVMNLGLSEEKALEVINEIWNATCIPPWDLDELRVKIENASRYAQNDAGAWAVPPTGERIPREALDKLIADAQSDASPQREERARHRFTPIFAREFNSLPKPVYAIEQLVPAQSITLLYGASGSFKSFIVQDLLASTAAGISALNKFRTVQGPAVMSAGEAPFGIAHKRAPAWALARGIEDLSNFPFAIVPAVPLVSDEGQIKAFVAETKAANIAPRIVAFDTVARAMGGLDENEARAAGLMIAAAEYVIAELGCAVVLVAHSGKDEAKGVRGSSALFAGVDAVFNVARAKDTLAVTLACEKMKDADAPADIHLQGQAVAGSLVFSAISADEHAALSKSNPPLSQADIMKALRDAGAVGGVEITTRQLAVSMLAGSDGDPKALQAMEKRLRRSAEKQLAAYVVTGTGLGSGSALKWTFPTIANEGGEHV